MEIRQLEIFITIAQQGSFSKAADKLYLSQSTISAHIKNLEKELNKTLMIRTTKSLELSDEGRRFLPYAQRIMETKDLALKAMEDNGNYTLNIGASTIPSGYILPGLIAAYNKQNPNVNFEIKQSDSRDIHESLLDSYLELGFVGTKYTNSKLKNIAICSDELLIVCPATEHYINLINSLDPLKNIVKEPFIMREKGSATQYEGDIHLENLGIDPKSLMCIAVTNDLESQKAMIQKGLGVGICSSLAVDKLIKDNKCVTLPLGIKRTFYISHLKNRTLKNETQSFINFAMEFFA